MSSKYDKFKSQSIVVQSGAGSPIKSKALAIAQRTLAQDIAEISRVVGNILDVLFLFAGSTTGSGGLVRSDENRYDYTYDFSAESGIRPADIGIEGRNIFVYSAKDDTVYNDVDYDSLDPIFYKINDNNETRPATIYEAIKALKDDVDTAISSIVVTASTGVDPVRILIVSNEYLDVDSASAAFAQFYFDPSEYPGKSIYFTVVGQVNGPTSGLSLDVSLYDLDNAELVSNTTHNFSTTDPVYKKSVALTVGASSGNFKEDGTIYEIRATFNSVADADDIALIGTVFMVIA